MKNNSWYNIETKLEIATELLKLFPLEFMHEFPFEKGIDIQYITEQMDDKALTIIIALLQELGVDIC